jgi:hypothetical protein
MGSFLEGTVEEEEGMAARCEWSVAKKGKRKGRCIRARYGALCCHEFETTLIRINDCGYREENEISAPGGTENDDFVGRYC